MHHEGAFDLIARLRSFDELLDEVRIARSTSTTGLMVGCRSFFAGLLMSRAHREAATTRSDFAGKRHII